MKELTPSERWLFDLSRLYDISQSFDSTLDLPALLRQVLQAAITLSDASAAAIFLTDPASHRHSQLARRDGDGVIFEPASLAQYRDAAEILSAEPTDASLLPATRPDSGTVFFPLDHKGERIGAIGILDRPNEAADWPRVQALLVGLSGHAAIAIENARLYQQSIDRTKELTLLVESSNAVSSSLDLGSVLNAISRQMMRALGTHWCIISGWDPTTAEIYRLAEYRHAIWNLQTGPQLSSERYPCHYELLENLTAGLQQITGSSPPARQRCLVELGAKRMLIAPIIHGSRIAGMVELADLSSDETFETRQIMLCRHFAAETAPPLLDGDTLNTEQMLEAVKALLGRTRTNWCSLYDCRDNGLDFRRLLSYGNGVWLDSVGPAKAIDSLPTLKIVATEHRIAVMRSTDTSLTPDELGLFERIGPSALLALPLVFKNKAVGLVRLYDINPARRFSSREMALAHALANQAAVALENAHLVTDLQRSLAELKAMQSRLVHAARLSALGEMSTVIAHQINNPLTTVLGDAEMLIQDISEDDPAHESAKAVLRAGRRAKEVVERMLTLTRREEQRRDLDLNNTIREAVALVGSQITSKRIQLDVSLGEGIPLVSALPGQLEDVWINLLINARDAVVEQMENDPQTEGRIEVTSGLTTDENLVMVTVIDNGCGMPPEQLAQIFDPFYTTKPRGQGTGLGLYIVRQIIGEHNGDLQLDSEPSHGTRVSIYIPSANTAVKE